MFSFPKRIFFPPTPIPFPTSHLLLGSQVLKRLKSGPSPQSRGTPGSYGSLTDASCFGHPRREDFGCGSIFYNPQKSQREGSCGRVKRGLGKPCLLIRLVLDRRQAGRQEPRGLGSTRKGKLTAGSRKTPSAWPALRLSLPTVNPGVLHPAKPGPFFLSQRGERK